MAQPIITLTTDFGSNDHLVGAMKGVILKIIPEANIVDISHSVMPFDVLDAALTIGQAYKYFPSRTIHVVVVDPGVGSQRRPIVASGDQHYFVAPDNGVLSMVYDQEERLTVRHVTAEHYYLTPISNTFHGRDVFAPVAAWLAKNGQPASFGEPISDFTRFTVPRPKRTGNTLKGVVLKVDNFGNLITNLTAEEIPALVAGETTLKMNVGGKDVTKVVHTYAQGAPNEAVATMGSSGYLEICVNRGSAARLLGAHRGSEVAVELG